jgi:adenylate cyclase
MPQEIERKFLVTPQDWANMPHVQIRDITQGYISKSKKHTVRVRLSIDDFALTTFQEAFITIKGPKRGMSCAEFEYEIPYTDGIELIKMCEGNLIEKTRYKFRHTKQQWWEVDVFHGQNEGLCVAEIELASEDTEVVLPDWIVQEVTYDKRYTNSYLSTHPIKS